MSTDLHKTNVDTPLLGIVLIIISTVLFAIQDATTKQLTTSVVAHLMLIKALEVSSAVVLQPFNYLILVWAILLGFWLFGEVLALHQIVGAGIVVSSGLFVGFREYVTHRKVNTQVQEPG